MTTSCQKPPASAGGLGLNQEEERGQAHLPNPETAKLDFAFNLESLSNLMANL